MKCWKKRWTGLKNNFETQKYVILNSDHQKLPSGSFFVFKTFKKPIFANKKSDQLKSGI